MKTHQEAYEDLAAHTGQCSTCIAEPTQGIDASRLCATGKELFEEYQTAKKQGAPAAVDSVGPPAVDGDSPTGSALEETP